ncbi:MAG: type VI secretion system protein TssA [Enterobacteriaceae bacterium]
MDTIVQHPWRALLLTTLPSEAVCMALADEHPHWKYINEEMIKLGSMAQNQLDIAQIQTRAITLLAHETKDCRLFSYLLQTLQYNGIPANLLLALTLLADYVDHFWHNAWPGNAIHKRRLTQQILKRFAEHASHFARQATSSEQAEAQYQFSRLQMRWRQSEPKLAQEVSQLSVSYQPAATQLDLLHEEPAEAQEPPMSPSLSVKSLSDKILANNTPSPASAVANNIVSNNIVLPQDAVTNPTVWQDTLLNIAELLCEQHPELPIGYRLRRNAIWSSINCPPQPHIGKSTTQNSPAAERIATYFNALSCADPQIWLQLEQNLRYYPYWFDGHYLSAKMAQKQGHTQVAEAIRSELQQFIERLPTLRELDFADGTPFLSTTTSHWLAEATGRSTQESSINKQQDKIWRCYHEKGLEAALRAVEQQQLEQNEPRERFYSQMLSARLLEQAGFHTLAQQHYLNLLLAGKQLAVTDWEPSLFQSLQQKLPDRGEG